MQYSNKISNSQLRSLSNSQKNNLRNDTHINLSSGNDMDNTVKSNKGYSAYNIKFSSNYRDIEALSDNQIHFHNSDHSSLVDNELNRNYDTLPLSFYDLHGSNEYDLLHKLSVINDHKQFVGSLSEGDTEMYNDENMGSIKKDQRAHKYSYYSHHRNFKPSSGMDGILLVDGSNVGINNFLEYQTNETSRGLLDSVGVYVNVDQHYLNSIFIADETKLPIYIAAFGSGFFSVIICLCTLLYFKYICSRLRGLKNSYASNSDGSKLLVENDKNVLNSMNLAEIRSTNPFLTRIEDYIRNSQKKQFKYNRKPVCNINNLAQYNDSKNTNTQNNPSNIIDELFTTFGNDIGNDSDTESEIYADDNSETTSSYGSSESDEYIEE